MNLIDGISFCIALQLLIVSSALLYKTGPQKLFLAVTGFIISISFFQVPFAEMTKTSFFFQLLFLGKKYILIPPLLFMYIRREKYTVNSLLQHFILPTLYVVFFYLLQTQFSQYYENYSIPINALNYSFAVVYFIIYFLKGRLYINSILKYSITKEAITKYTRFYYTFNFIEVFILCILSFSLISELLEFAILKKIIDSIHKVVVYFVFIFGTSLTFYFLSESYFFKKKFLKNNISTNPEVYKKDTEIGLKIDTILIDKKKFLSPNYSVKQLSIDTQLDEDIINQYFKEVKKETFKVYLYRMRINVFLKLIEEKKTNQYDIGSLAEMCGFNSRTTFYRAFKAELGLTPKEYIKSKI